MINAIATAGNWSSIMDIKAEDVERYGTDLVKKHKRSKRTVGKHVGFAKQFASWLVSRGRLPGSPLAGVKKPNPETDRRVQRRALRFDEWPKLIEATKNGSAAGDLTPEARALLYEFAVQTGLRQNEVRSITPGKLKLEQVPPYALVPKSTTKNAQLARQYMTADLARRLRAFIDANKSPGPVFRLPHESDLAEVLRSDLAAARNAWIKDAKTKELRKERSKSDFLAAKNHEGEVIDFHSLRHTCGTWLALRGENIKTVQSIMRHSTITLTMDRYGHLFPAMDADAVQRLEPCFR